MEYINRVTKELLIQNISFIYAKFCIIYHLFTLSIYYFNKKNEKK